MKMKFVSLLALSLFVSASPQAGFYAGGTFGFGNFSMNNNNVAFDEDQSEEHLGTKVSQSWFVPGLLAGYSFALSPCWFLSPEVYALFANAQKSSSQKTQFENDITLKSSAKLQTVLGLGARLGYQMLSGLGIFGKLGVEFTQLKTKAEFFDADGNPCDNSKLEQSNWTPGLAIGAGLETKMGGVIVRGDYTLSIFQGSGKKTLTYDDTDNALLTNKLSGVRSHRVMVSFVVPFGK